ncbi:hypothetical protein B0J11DRAFT_584273 [Dendryphion nanum]|uniref:Uncharacterized protein n=1 Tax=Dendryphion nanum TaxID=256645 RepID=A0A9P9DC17_9PLEO|nr:hypothetical protein B0J11DRAFT_584273 [Dendryphion nanum]
MAHILLLILCINHAPQYTLPTPPFPLNLISTLYLQPFNHSQPGSNNHDFPTTHEVKMWSTKLHVELINRVVSLPPELRNAIYEDTLIDHDPTSFFIFNNDISTAYHRVSEKKNNFLDEDTKVSSSVEDVCHALVMFCRYDEPFRSEAITFFISRNNMMVNRFSLIEKYIPSKAPTSWLHEMTPEQRALIRTLRISGSEWIHQNSNTTKHLIGVLQTCTNLQSLTFDVDGYKVIGKYDLQLYTNNLSRSPARLPRIYPDELISILSSLHKNMKTQICLQLDQTRGELLNRFTGLTAAQRLEQVMNMTARTLEREVQKNGRFHVIEVLEGLRHRTPAWIMTGMMTVGWVLYLLVLTWILAVTCRRHGDRLRGVCA